jgi:hypothetical protein
MTPSTELSTSLSSVTECVRTVDQSYTALVQSIESAGVASGWDSVNAVSPSIVALIALQADLETFACAVNRLSAQFAHHVSLCDARMRSAKPLKNG